MEENKAKVLTGTDGPPKEVGRGGVLSSKSGGAGKGNGNGDSKITLTSKSHRNLRNSIEGLERKSKPILSSGVRKITSLSEARKFLSTLDTGDIFLHKSTGAFACCTRLAMNSEWDHASLVIRRKGPRKNSAKDHVEYANQSIVPCKPSYCTCNDDSKFDEDRIEIMESTYAGVHTYYLEERLARRGDHDVIIACRRLRRFNNKSGEEFPTKKMRQDLEVLINQVKGRAYQNSPLVLANIMMQHRNLEHSSGLESSNLPKVSSAKSSKKGSSLFNTSIFANDGSRRRDVVRVDKEEVSRLFCSQVVTAGLQQMKVMKKSKRYNTQSLSPDDFSTIGGGDDILGLFVSDGIYYEDEVILKFPGSPYDAFLRNLRARMRLRALAPLRDRNPYMHIFNPDAILTGKERRESKDTKKEAWSIVGSMNKRALDAVAEAVTSKERREIKKEREGARGKGGSSPTVLYRSTRSIATMLTGDPEEPGLKHASATFLSRLSAREMKSYRARKASVKPLNYAEDHAQDDKAAAVAEEKSSSDSGSWRAEANGGAEKERRASVPSTFLPPELQDKPNNQKAEGDGVDAGADAGSSSSSWLAEEAQAPSSAVKYSGSGGDCDGDG